MYVLHLLVTIGLIHFTNATPIQALSTPPERPGPSRRGIAYNNPAYVSYFNVEGTHTTWCYNWDSTSPATSGPFEFVAMLHSNHPDHTGKWAAAVERSARAQPDNPTHLLGFNEPDNCLPGAGGACMGVAPSVEAWNKFMEPAKNLKEKMYLGSPAVSNGGSPMGLDWLRKFMDACVGCHIDFINIHWYDSATNFEYFKRHIEDARVIAKGRPIWITEFAATGTDEQIKVFLNQAIPYLDATEDIHRYAYFMAMPNSLLSPDGSSLSDIGRHFVYWRKQGSGFSVDAANATQVE